MSSKVLKRNELKYLITLEQFNDFQKIVDKYLDQDKFHISRIKNIYYDTDDYLLIRRSIEKPNYKEKIRIRTYNEGINPEVFVEIKRKCNSVVFKRRVKMKFDDAKKLLNFESIEQNGQIINEIKYFVALYKCLKPKMYLSYDRLSYIAKEDKNLRTTFDSNIQWVNGKQDFIEQKTGNYVLDNKHYLMEIKTEMGYPRWLCDFLSDNKIYKTSFSKYGNAYIDMLKVEKEENNGYTVNIA
jgi:hypothetical protein